MNAIVSQPTTQLPAEVSIGFANASSFELTQRVAKMYSASALVPKDYQNNIPNCAIAVNMAARINADVLMVMQNLVVVHGRPTWSAQFLIATVNSCGRFTALRYEMFGEKGTDEWGCRAYAIEKSTGEKLVGTEVTIAIAKAEGWYSKNGSKWKTIPEQMLKYRAAGWWTRAYAPELSMGLQTSDERTDTIDMVAGADGTFVAADDLVVEVSAASILAQADAAEAAEAGEGEGDKEAAPEVTVTAEGDKIDAKTGEVLEQAKPAADPKPATEKKAETKPAASKSATPEADELFGDQ